MTDARTRLRGAPRRSRLSYYHATGLMGVRIIWLRSIRFVVINDGQGNVITLPAS